MDDAGIDTVTLAAGRPDFTAFPAENQEEYWGRGVTADQDPLADILDTLRTPQRSVGITIDALAPRIVEKHDAYQAAFADGTPAEDFPSATALHEGEVGERITTLCGAVAKRYEPDYLVLTELIGEAFFSPADETLYSEMTGNDGFPRTPDGTIRTADDTLNDWQSHIITNVITRCADAADLPVEMDARVNWEHPGDNRFDSGHRYEDILATGAHLALWAYTGLEGVSPATTGDIATRLRERFDEQTLRRIRLTVGLWGDMTPEDVRTAFDAARDAAPEMAMSLTPLSMMGEEHWELLS